MAAEEKERKAVNRRDEIKRLLDRYVAIVESPRNREKKTLWEDMPFSFAVNKYQDPPNRKWTGKIPVLTDPGNGLHRRRLGYSVKDYFTDPETYLWAFLDNMLYHHDMIPDDRWFKPRIGVWLSATHEATMFGKGTTYTEMEDPWPAAEPALKKREDLDSLEPPDFFRSGMMPLAHRFYEELSRLVEGWPLTVEFPGWQRSPWGVAFAVRGLANLLEDAIDAPEFLSRLMSFIVECRKKWYLDAEKFLGHTISPAPMLNDEVHVPTISPRFYEQYVLPGEKELGGFHRGIYCWHSCGDCTPMLHLIRQIPNLLSLSVNVGTWKLEAVVKTFADTPLEICVPSLDYVLKASENQMREQIAGIIQTCRKHNARTYFLRANALNGTGEGDWRHDFDQIRLWVRTANEVIAQQS